MDNLKRMTSLFDTIADETRRKLLEALREALDADTEVSVGDLVESVGVSQPTVSKHLKVLRDVELVSVRLEGQRRYYALRPEALDPVLAWLDSIRGTAALETPPAAAPEPDLPDTVYLPVVPKDTSLNRAGARLGEVIAEVKVRGTEAIDAVEAGATKGVDNARSALQTVSTQVADRVVRPVLRAFSRER